MANALATWLGMLLSVSLFGCAQAEVVPRGPVTIGLTVQQPSPKPNVAATPQALMQPGGVRSLQRALNAQGYALTVDGRFDNETRQALLSFQRREGLAPTSLPDLATCEALGLDPQQVYQALDG